MARLYCDPELLCRANQKFEPIRRSRYQTTIEPKITFHESVQQWDVKQSGCHLLQFQFRKP
jgi:hypothetical protein